MSTYITSERTTGIKSVMCNGKETHSCNTLIKSDNLRHALTFIGMAHDVPLAAW